MTWHLPVSDLTLLWMWKTKLSFNMQKISFSKLWQ